MTYRSFISDDPFDWKDHLLRSANTLPYFTFLDSCDYPDVKGTYDWICAGGAMSEFAFSDKALDSFREVRERSRGWWFGRLNYDLKNHIEDLSSSQSERFGWSDTRFYEAEWVVFSQDGQVHIRIHPASELSVSDLKTISEELPEEHSSPVELISGMNREEYLTRARSLLTHIQRGDIYEVNFCQEFYADDVKLNPVHTYRRLRKVASPPMSALLRCRNEWVISMSPERYIQKTGSKILSQPIKGTARRSEDPEEDKYIADTLYHDQKERAENVMIVDLVRNDLSRVARRNSVEVTELFGIHPFRTVYQMISTIEAELKEDADIFDLISATFPMGSMTGAPKISAMKLIEEHEIHKRGIYSGAIGYITPEDDIDFNVVIRSVVYDEILRKLSVSVGSALTGKAIPENEWEECILKLKAIREVLANPMDQAN